MHAAGFANIPTSQPAGRWPGADRRVHRRRRALRAARQQADAGGDRRLPPASRRRSRRAAARARSSSRSAGSASTRRWRLLGRSRHRRAAASRASATALTYKPARRSDRDRVVSPEPAEHEHGQADAADARKRCSRAARGVECSTADGVTSSALLAASAGRRAWRGRRTLRPIPSASPTASGAGGWSCLRSVGGRAHLDREHALRDQLAGAGADDADAEDALGLRDR